MAPAPAPSTSTSPVTGQPESIADDGPSISVRNLSYTFASTTTTTTTTTSGSTSSTPSVVLHDVSFDLPSGSRTLLIGANGAGKTTLLRLLSGGKLAPSGRIRVGGVDPFTTGLEGVTYLGLEWALNPIVRNDIEVWRLLDSVCGVVRGPGGPGGRAGKSSSEHGGDLWRERRNELVRVLDVDEDWHMNLVSDGERRRVQLCIGLVRPWSVLLLDEVTVDLDVLARSRLLCFLKRETLERCCTIIYATHIMDGLAGWPTHLVRMTLGRVRFAATVDDLGLLLDRRCNPATTTTTTKDGTDHNQKQHQKQQQQQYDSYWRNSVLLDLVLEWLEEDFAERGPRNKLKPKIPSLS